MPLGWDEGRVAELICTVRDGKKWRQTRASGYRITADKVLTCAHAVVKAKTVKVRFGAGTTEHPSTDEWTATAGKPIVLGHDLALLPIDAGEAPKQSKVFTPAFGRVTSGLVHPAAQAVGFPRGQAREETSTLTGRKSWYRESKQATGDLDPLSGLKMGTWEFAVTNPLPGTYEHDRSSWEGMSGAAVWVGGVIVGVITKDVHPRLANTFTVVPLTLLWKKPPTWTVQPLTELFNCQEPMAWDDVGLPPALRNVVADHRHQTFTLAPAEGVKDREQELAQMKAFCRQNLDEGYWWWRARPWYGKTALMSTFAIQAPPDLCVVSFFLNAQRIDRNDSDDFLAATLPQLDAFSGQSKRTEITPGAKEQTFRRRLGEVAKICQERGAHLVLLIDALDEEDWNPLLQSRSNIVSLLPVRPIKGLRVIISSRPNPDLLTDLPHDHPLRTTSVRHDLVESPHAQEVQLRALKTLERLELENSLEWHAIALIAVVGSGLSTVEVAEILGDRPNLVKNSMARSSLLLGQAHYFSGRSETIYILAHDTLSEEAEKFLAREEVHKYQQKISHWVDRYSAQGWPSSTPRFLLTDAYAELLVAATERDRLIGVALDRARQIRLLIHTGSTLQAYKDILRAEQANLGSEYPDLSRALQLCVSRNQIESLALCIPYELPAVYVYIGQYYRAFTLANCITDFIRRASTFAEMARALVEADQDPLDAVVEALSAARHIADSNVRVRVLGEVACIQAIVGDKIKALATVRQIIEPADRARVLAEVARALVEAGQDSASTVVEAVTVARQIVEPADRARVLAEVARALVKAGQNPASIVYEGVAAARQITDFAERTRVLTEMARTLVQAGQNPASAVVDALVAAQRIANSDYRTRALLEIAQIQVTAGQDPAIAVAAAVSAVQEITHPGHRARVLIAVARGMTEIGHDPTSDVIETVVSARQITDPYERNWALGESAVAHVVIGHEADALAIANEITDPRNRLQTLSVMARSLANAGHNLASTVVEALTSLLEQVLITPTNLTDPEALSAVAHAQAEAGYEVKALATLQKITDLDRRVWALVEVALVMAKGGHDPTTTVVEAVSTAQRINKPGYRDLALSEAALVQIDVGYGDEALSTVRKISDLERRPKVMADVALALAERGHDPAPAVVEAVAAARRITYFPRRARIMARVARAIAKAGQDPTPIVIEVMAAERQIIDDDERARVLAEVAWALAEAGQNPAPFVDRAASTAQHVTHPDDRAWVLAEVSWILAEVGRSLAEAGQDPVRIVHKAVSTAQQIIYSDLRAWALVKVAQVQTNLRQDSAATVIEAVSAIQQMTDPGHRTWILGELALTQVAAGQDIAPAVVQAVATAQPINYTRDRSRALAELIVTQLKTERMIISMQETAFLPGSSVNLMLWNDIAKKAFEKGSAYAATTVTCKGFQKTDWYKVVGAAMVINPESNKIIEEFVGSYCT